MCVNISLITTKIALLHYRVDHKKVLMFTYKSMIYQNLGWAFTLSLGIIIDIHEKVYTSDN